MIDSRILIKEALDTYRLDLCAIQDGDLRERLIRAFDRVYSLLKFDNFADESRKIKDLKDEIDDFETEKGDLEDEVYDLKEEIEDKKAEIKDHIRILRHLQETIGQAICPAPQEAQQRLHDDYEIVDAIIKGDLPPYAALNLIKEIKEAANV